MKKYVAAAVMFFAVIFLSGHAGVSAQETDIEEAKELIVEAMENFEAECDLSQYAIPATEIKGVFEDILFNNPQLFYVDNYFRYTYIQEGNLVKVLRIGYKDHAKSMCDQYDEKLTEIESGIDGSWSKLEILLYIHDYICLNTTYDETLDTAYDMLVTGRASCQGYSKAFKQIANDMGIECTLVNSTAIDHQWNYVVLNGKYYYVDVTWDDPVPDVLGRVMHTHFLKSYQALLRDGVHNGAAADLYAKDGSDVRMAASATYDNYFWKDVNTAFYPIDGKWYAGNQKGQICSYTCNGKKMKRSKKLKTVSDKWYVWKDTKRFYTTKYAGLSMYGGQLYYSTPTDVYQLKPENGKVTKVYTLSASKAKKGNIYGLYIKTNGALQIALATSGTTVGTVHKVFTLKTIGKPAIKKLKKTKKGIQVKWGKVKNASGYYVYAKAGKGKWKKIATVKGAAKVSYTDTSAMEKKRYTYKIYAYYKCPAGMIASGKSAAKSLKR